MADAPIADAAARRRALDPAGSFIVQAPAGSGKTELLTQRYLNLLAHVEHPEEVIAITFTRKAANEMRNRVLGALEKAADIPRPAAAHEALTWDLAQQALARDRERQWELLANPNRLRVRTIDSLCAALTRQMPLLARFGAQPAIVDDAAPLYRRAAQETLSLIEAKEDWWRSVERLLAHLDNNLALVADLLATMLAKRDQWLRHVAAREHLARETLEAGLRNSVCDGLAKLREAVPPAHAPEILALADFAGANLRAAGADSAISLCENLVALPGAEPEDLARWRGLAELLLTKAGEWRKAVTKANGFPAASSGRSAAEKAQLTGMKERCSVLIAALAGDDSLRARLAGVADLPPVRYEDAQWEVIEALYELLHVAVGQLTLVFREEGKVDFAEVALGAIQALGAPEQPTDLALSLDYRVRHLLVDEFQDTSLGQYELLSRLTAGWEPGDGRTLFVVGDPMQSIYRFRQAEVGLYLRARRAGIGEIALTPLTLEVNFRSEAGIVDWVNWTFAQVLPATEDVGAGGVPYARAVAFRPAGSHPAVAVHPFIGAQNEAEAERVAVLVQQAQAADDKARIAVLVRSRSHLADIAPRLKALGLRFRAVEIEALRHRPVVHDLFALTRALLHPADRIAWLAVLRAPWCGLTLHDLDVLAGDDHASAIWDLTGDPARTARLTPDGRERLARVRDVLGTSLAARRRMPVRVWVEAVWRALGGPACVEDETDLEDAQVYLALLEQAEEGGDVRDVVGLADKVAALYALPDIEADERLQLMTIHKAKGLEFDVVILPGLGRRPRNDEAQLLLWTERPRADDTDLLVAPIPERGRGEEPIYRFLMQQEKQKQAYEDGRLLYVAATRARKALHLLGSVPSPKEDQPPAPDSRSLLAKLWPAVARDFIAASGALPGPREMDGAPAAPRPSGVRRLARGWLSPPPPPAVAWHPDAPASAVSAGTPVVEFVWASETIRCVGIIVHRALQQLAREGCARWDEARIQALRPAFERLLLAEGLPLSEAGSAAGRVVAALSGTLSDPRGGWILDAAHAEARAEYALAGIIDGRTVSVIIDRSFVDSDGVRWIIDYKTSAHEGGGVEAFLDREQERYRGQLERYALLMSRLDPRPIRLGLYFPLLHGWREWPYSP